MKKLSTDGQRIVNEDGEQVILNGVNLVCKEKAKGYVDPCDESLFTWFHEQGFNVVRLGLIWDGVEPEPGVYDNEYLGTIKQQIKWAEQNDIYVFLDMHQDLYSLLYGDGAPEWATFSDDLPHVVGQIWSDAYLESPALNRALDHFWENTPATDGIGLQDHYAAMWKHAAEFFADCSNIIGYDMMNEPYPGSRGQEVFGTIIAAYAQSVMGMTEVDMEQLSALWFDEEKKQEILVGMADMEIYRILVESAKEASQVFEREVLAPFFNKTAAAIRSVVPDGFLMLETSYFANMGVESGLELVQNNKGMVVHNQVFAPHGYDLVVDTEHYEIYNQDRVDLIFSTHRKVQERLNIPALIGEWGAFSNHPATFELSKSLISIFEKYLWSNTYWCWCDGFKDSPYTKALNRAYPQATGGVLVGYHYDYDTDILKVDYVPSGGETLIYHPRVALISKENVVVSGADACQIEFRPFPSSESGIVAIIAPQAEIGITVTVGKPPLELV
ncbi:cellulase family glycosylhydrolase [Paenibacillus macquariensis]|uniref:Endoglycosylceramidase n=1 Tax=Paenibacillus macquariensis TaxID=948756 RepID=A0ABY1KEA5_9BACL|nr:cellulase family glycosylhydrolase [Paenibacillus macquariensis]MEC0094170.1 cellulase family glycosylhydrolase [Paenibacillus macquariensis]OAB26961.1 glycosyl hydrolase family 5 [Paenibacillus macquariensis subsp. macquariensis]SIR70248.1 endoglycosylceramidase [Paenibacillus macquariensis]